MHHGSAPKSTEQERPPSQWTTRSARPSASAATCARRPPPAASSAFFAWTWLLRPHPDRRAQIVVDDALSPAQVAELNALYDAVLAGEAPPEFDGPNVKSLRGSSAGKNMPLSSVIADRHGREYEGRRFWGQPYVDLIDLPTVLPILEELLGQPSWEHAPRAVPVELRSRIRLDHDNIHHQAAHTGGTEHLSESADEAAVERKMRGSSLHGGPTAHHITCVYELKSVGKGEGGFGCLPGCKQAPATARGATTLPLTRVAQKQRTPQSTTKRWSNCRRDGASNGPTRPGRQCTPTGRGTRSRYRIGSKPKPASASSSQVRDLVTWHCARWIERAVCLRREDEARDDPLEWQGRAADHLLQCEPPHPTRPFPGRSVALADSGRPRQNTSRSACTTTTRATVHTAACKRPALLG